MKVKLTYFDTRGKYKYGGEYETQEPFLYKIWEEVEAMFTVGRRPGLIPGYTPYIVLVEVPEHEYNHPHLILPIE